MVTSLLGLMQKAGATSGRALTDTEVMVGQERISAALSDESPTGMMLIGLRQRHGSRPLSPADVGPIRVNRAACEMLGYTEAELRAMSMDDITDPADRATDEARFAALHAGDASTVHVEKKYVRKDGSALWVDLTTNAIGGRSDASPHFLTVMVDVTERKRAEAGAWSST
jgi:PAS domain S-box-containing protein